MKYIFVFFSMIFSASCLAGGYYVPWIDTYDPETGLYYKSVWDKEKSGLLGSVSNVAIVNLYIFNPSTGEGKYLFPKNGDFKKIVALVFETAVEDGVVKYQNDHEKKIKNNSGISPRPPKANMLIVTREAESERETFYFAEKDGTKLREVTSISPSADWHVDVKNSSLRIVSQSNQEVTITSFNW